MSCVGGQALPRPHAALRLRCEQLFVTAGRSMKEISKTSVSFWLRLSIPRAYRLSGTEQPVPAPRAQETRGIAPSLLFKKNFTVDQVLKAGTWRKRITFTLYYLRDIAHQSLDTILPGHVVAVQALVSPWPACLDIPRLTDSGLTFDYAVLCLSPSIHRHSRWAVTLMVSICHHI